MEGGGSQHACRRFGFGFSSVAVDVAVDHDSPASARGLARAFENYSFLPFLSLPDSTFFSFFFFSRERERERYR